MSFDSLLIDLCTIQRYAEGGFDGYGNPILTWDLTYLVDERCRLTTAKGMELKIGAEIVVADYKLFLSGIDITERDRVVIGANSYEILLVEDYADHTSAHHKQCWLRIAR